MSTPTSPAARLVQWRDDPHVARGRDVMVLIPSLGTDAGMFDTLVDSLEAAGSELLPLRLDLPGHGAAPPAATVTIEAVARDVCGSLEGAEARSIVVIGVSMGGAIALEIARCDVAALRGFVMVNSGATFGTESGWRALAESVRRSGTAALVAGSRAGWFSEPFASSEPARAILAAIADIDPPSYLACCAALAAYRGDDGIGSESAPALLIGTADDHATPPGVLRELADRLVDARYEELTSGRHLSLVEHSDAVARLILNWVGDLDAA